MKYRRYGPIMLSGLLGLQGCSRGADTVSTPAVVKASSEAAVELSAGQLRAVTIEPATSYRFVLQTQAPGSITFEEDLTVIQAESTLIAAAAAVELTSKNLARVRDLSGSEGGLAARELEQAVSDRQTASSNLLGARAAIRALGRSDTDIDRMIAAGRPEDGTTVGKWAVGYVPESDGAAISAGEPVEVRLSAFPGSFRGRVSRVYPVVDADTHRVRFRAEVQDPGDRLRPGMLAEVMVHVGAITAVAVRAAAIVREGDGTTTVWVTTDRHRFVRRSVQTGLRRDDRVQIVQGVRSGELVVTDGALFLSNLLQSPPTD